MDFSAITYTDGDDINEVILPTIQQLTVPDECKIPSKPTITGEYRQQYVINTAPRITFQILLDSNVTGKYSLSASGFVDLFKYLKDNRIQFNLSTSHSGEESQFLSDLVIQNVQYSRKSTLRDALMATVTCTKLQSINLEWEYVNVVEIFGKNIFTEKTDPGEMIAAFSLKDADSGLGLMKRTGFFGSIGYTPDTTSERVGMKIEKDVNLSRDCYYFSLRNPIEMDTDLETKIVNATPKFTYLYGNDEVTATLPTLEIEITTDLEMSRVGGIPLDKIGSFEYINSEYNLVTILESPARYRGISAQDYYNFVNTYPNVIASKSNSKFENYSPTLGNELKTYIRNNPQLLRKSSENLSPKYIEVVNNKIKVLPISEQFSYTIRWKDSGKKICSNSAPTGGFDYLGAYTETVNKIEFNHEDEDEINDQLAPYDFYIIPVTVGTQLQIYIVEPWVLIADRVVVSGDD